MKSEEKNKYMGSTEISKHAFGGYCFEGIQNKDFNAVLLNSLCIGSNYRRPKYKRQGSRWGIFGVCEGVEKVDGNAFRLRLIATYIEEPSDTRKNSIGSSPVLEAFALILTTQKEEEQVAF